MHDFLKKLFISLSAVAATAVLFFAPTLYDAVHTPAGDPTGQTASAAGPESYEEYIEITESCGPYFEGECVRMRSGPGTEYAVIGQLRKGVVLKVYGEVHTATSTWYKIEFDEWLRYPERVSAESYVSSEYARAFYDRAATEVSIGTAASTSRRIIVDRSEQMLYAYDGDTLFMKQPISTGIELTPTPRGLFHIYKKTPTRYMQGPIPGISDHYYDLPGVPWNLYFTAEGAVLHGAYWHDHFGTPWSNGCVNLPPEKAHELYDWAELGTPVFVRD